jgi:collagen type III alpha
MTKDELLSWLTAALTPLFIDVAREIAELRGKVAALPAPRDGKDGKDGKSVTAEDVLPLVEKYAQHAKTHLLETLDAWKPDLAQRMANLLLTEHVDELRGAPGAPGDQGPPGPIGERGAAGPHGPEGPRGERGETGAPGAAGAAGEPGAQGVPGAVGPQGERGELGERGERGEPGADGAAGERGLQGERGADGLPGAPGERGERGESGERGAQGERGVAGERGERGERGEPGQSVSKAEVLEELGLRNEAQLNAFLLIAERRVNDMVAARLASIEPPQDGKDGRDGVDGKDGRDGANGVNGVNGKDAVPIELGELDFKQQGRELQAWRGETQLLAWKLDFIRDCGVYKAGQAYDKGDAVSYGGSLWIAQRDTSAKPESDDSWRLAAKRGRDGKDGKEGPPGDRGPPGKDGKPQW